jgi:hypothetical protein
MKSIEKFSILFFYMGPMMCIGGKLLLESLEGLTSKVGLTKRTLLGTGNVPLE